jgi:hypothetical protein
LKLAELDDDVQVSVLQNDARSGTVGINFVVFKDVRVSLRSISREITRATHGSISIEHEWCVGGRNGYIHVIYCFIILGGKIDK